VREFELEGQDRRPAGNPGPSNKSRRIGGSGIHGAVGSAIRMRDRLGGVDHWCARGLPGLETMI